LVDGEGIGRVVRDEEDGVSSALLLSSDDIHYIFKHNVAVRPLVDQRNVRKSDCKCRLDVALRGLLWHGAIR
jgi:hypothetical protein